MQEEIFPNTLIEFEKEFATEEQCRDYLFKMKYPNGFCCPKCNHNEYWLTTKNHLLHCKNCGRQTSLKVGTIMESSNKSLLLWFHAIFLVAFQKSGISAKNLQNQLGFGSYQTAWSWLHKIRNAMRREGRSKLFGYVETDESLYGGIKKGKRGRGAENKQYFAVGVELKTGTGLGRIRMDVIENAGGQSLKKFIENNVKENSNVITDGWNGYNFLKDSKYDHSIVETDDPDKKLPHIHLVVSLFKRWILGIHQGSINKKHLQLYLDEFVFRFNRRKSKSRGKVFFRLMQQAVVNKAIPYWKIVGRLTANIPLKAVA